MKKVYIEQHMRTKEERSSGKKNEVMYALEVGDCMDVLASRLGMGVRYFAKGKTDCFWIFDELTEEKFLINKLIFMKMMEAHTNLDLKSYKVHGKMIRAFLYRRPPMAYGNSISFPLIHNEAIIQGIDVFGLHEYEMETRRFRIQSVNYKKRVAQAEALKKDIEETEEYLRKYQEMIDEVRDAYQGVQKMEEDLKVKKFNLRTLRNMGVQWKVAL